MKLRVKGISSGKGESHFHITFPISYPFSVNPYSLSVCLIKIFLQLPLLVLFKPFYLQQAISIRIIVASMTNVLFIHSNSALMWATDERLKPKKLYWIPSWRASSPGTQANTSRGSTEYIFKARFRPSHEAYTNRGFICPRSSSFSSIISLTFNNKKHTKIRKKYITQAFGSFWDLIAKLFVWFHGISTSREKQASRYINGNSLIILFVELMYRQLWLRSFCSINTLDKNKNPTFPQSFFAARNFIQSKL